MEYKYARFFRLFNSFLDYLILNVSLVAAYFLVPLSFETATVGIKLYVLFANLIWFFSTSQTDLYDKVLKTDAVPYMNKSIWTLAIFSIACFGLHLAVPEVIISDLQLLKALSFFALVLLTSKILFLFVRKSQRRFWIDYKKVVILGSGTAAKELFDYFSDHNSGYIVEGFFCDSDCNPGVKEFKYLGKIDASVDYCTRHDISEIFSTLPASRVETVKVLMAEADSNMLRFRFVPDLSEVMNKDMLIEYYGALPIVSKRKEPLEIKVNQIVKDGFDYAFSFLVTVFIFSWLFPIVAIAIKLDSPGPIFFRQLRSGKDNNPFFCLKFRSMYVNRDADSLQATKGDKRITRVGAFMRKTSIDELPQFLNVLMGDMSIVGPRPHMLNHTEQYAGIINDYMVRQFASPGITGWAQINGLRGETKETESMIKRVKADIWYLENWSFLLDIKIVFLTVFQSFGRNEKAY